MQVSLGFVALVFITSTVYLYYQNYKLFQNPQKTMGKIIGITTDKTGISKDTIFSDKVVIKEYGITVFAPVFSYTDLQGVEHIIKSEAYSDIEDFNIGDEVEIIYNKKDPTIAKVNSTFQVWGTAWIFTALSVILTASVVLSIIL
jgi:hypothetical protein